MNNLADRVAASVIDLFRPRRRTVPTHPAYGFISDIKDALTVCVQGKAHISRSLKASEYRAYVAGLTRDERIMFTTIKAMSSPRGGEGGLARTLECMSEALATAEIVSRKLSSMNRERMNPDLAEALGRFEAKLPG